jgi:hypothetical protein
MNRVKKPIEKIGDNNFKILVSKTVGRDKHIRKCRHAWQRKGGINRRRDPNVENCDRR